MSTLVISPGLADANAGAVCYHRPLQRRGLSLGSTLSQQFFISPIPLRSPLGLRRISTRGLKLTQKSLRGTRADSETEERSSRAEGKGRATGGLDELDKQLRVLSSSDNLSSSPKEASKENEEKLPREEYKKVEWPVFGDGFVWYVSVGLILLTIINNILFRVFFGPKVIVQQPQGTQAPEVRQERYKLRSYNDPKYYLNAPPVTDKPLT